jgi:hypothetical protein
MSLWLIFNLSCKIDHLDLGGQNDTSEAEEEVWQKVRPYAEL